MPASLTPEQLQLVTTALDNGNVIEAIKLYRSFTGCGLKEAKDAVDQLRAEHDAKLPEGQRRKSGCMGVIVFLVLMGALSIAATTHWLV
ncbi:MAG: ribosomal protein L7/L12 [Planctomycetota bacterium]